MSDLSIVTPDSVAQLSDREIRRSIRRRWVTRTSILLGWGAFIGIWYILSDIVFRDPRLPSLHLVLQRAGRIIATPGFGSDLGNSVLRLLGGFLLALVISSVLGLLIAYSDWWRNLLQGFLQLIVSIPTIGYAVLALVLFGISPIGPVLTTMLVSIPYITLNVAQGIAGVDRRLIVMSEAFGRTRKQIARDVLLPSSLLSLLSGARLAFAVAWRMELLSEIFASSQGVGFQIRSSFERYDTQAMLAWTVIFVALMLIFEHLVLRQIDRWASHWRSAEPSATR